MILKSLSLKTELGLAASRGIITDRGDYVVIETPDDPGYYYGNLLIIPAAPQAGEVSYWTRKFHEEFRDPQIHHVTLCWDGLTSDAGCEAELLAAGFHIDRHVVLTTSTITAPSVPGIVELTPEQVLDTDDLGWSTSDRHDEQFREFLQRRSRWQATLVTRGLATFFGIYDGEVLVSSLGLVPMGPMGPTGLTVPTVNVARFQDVQTASTHRKRGYASALLAAAAAAVPATTYVIVCEESSDAHRVYERAGFQIAERTASAVRSPKPNG
ncbi:MAG TPA: GNAT family N-acetyltransferase [Kofleriaceae bacterium]